MISQRKTSRFKCSSSFVEHRSESVIALLIERRGPCCRVDYFTTMPHRQTKTFYVAEDLNLIIRNNKSVFIPLHSIAKSSEISGNCKIFIINQNFYLGLASTSKHTQFMLWIPFVMLSPSRFLCERRKYKLPLCRSFISSETVVTGGGRDRRASLDVVKAKTVKI